MVDHLAVAHEGLDDVRRGDAQELRDVLDARPRRHLDDQAFDRHDRRRVGAVALLVAAATAAAIVLGPPPRRDAWASMITRRRRCRRRPDALCAGRSTSGIRLVDDVLIDFGLAVGELHAGALEVGEHVFDGRITLAGDLSDRFHAGHSPHRLSLLADAGETSAQIVVDENARAERASSARLRVACSRQSGCGHSQAPRPDGRRAASTTRPSRTVSRTSASLGATRRQPTQVRRGHADHAPRPSLRRHLLSGLGFGQLLVAGDAAVAAARQRHVGAALAVRHDGHAAAARVVAVF